MENWLKKQRFWLFALVLTYLILQNALIWGVWFWGARSESSSSCMWGWIHWYRNSLLCRGQLLQGTIAKRLSAGSHFPRAGTICKRHSVDPSLHSLSKESTFFASFGKEPFQVFSALQAGMRSTPLGWCPKDDKTHFCSGSRLGSGGQEGLTVNLGKGLRGVSEIPASLEWVLWSLKV